MELSKSIKEDYVLVLHATVLGNALKGMESIGF